MTHIKPLNDEDISALVDNAVAGGRAHDTLSAVLHSDAAKATWHRYHLIGDILRSDNLAPTTSELNFAERVMAALPAQPPVLVQPLLGEEIAAVQVSSERRSANGREFWLKALTGTLCLAVLGMLVIALPQANAPHTTAQRSVQPGAIVASVPATKAPAVDVALEDERPIMTRDPELDALLSAHQQMGGHSALQAPAGFLRNATFERSRP